MPLDVVWDLSVGWYSDRLDPGYRPRSIGHLQGLIRKVGLTGEFWQLAPTA